jgi:hypothetical protein
MVTSTLRWHALVMKSTSPSLLLQDRVFYLEASVPPGLTLDEYRRGRRRRSTRWGRLKRLAGSGTAPAAA